MNENENKYNQDNDNEKCDIISDNADQEVKNENHEENKENENVNSADEDSYEKEDPNEKIFIFNDENSINKENKADEMNEENECDEESEKGVVQENSRYPKYDTSSNEDTKGDENNPDNNEKREFWSWKRIIILAALAGLVVGFVSGMIVNHMKNNTNSMDDSAAPRIELKTPDINESEEMEESDDQTTYNSISIDIPENLDVTDIVEKCMPSIVSITNEEIEEYNTMFGIVQQEVASSGSGIIVGESDDELLIVTNYHVVSNSETINVSFGDNNTENIVEAGIKGYDSQKDIAVLYVKLDDIPAEVRDEIVIATIGNSDELEVGEQVVAIGNAMGYGQSVTTGIVSAKDREVTIENTDGSTITNKLIQTDAAINPGNSGGALLNIKGEVVGINSVKFMSEEVEGMGYAIPISDIESIIGDLMNKETREKLSEEKRGWLGITCIDITDNISELFNMPKGVYVVSVEDGSAAEKAGIEEGDIIIKLGGNNIANYDELQNELQYFKAGETIELVVKHINNDTYEEKTVSVELSENRYTTK